MKTTLATGALALFFITIGACNSTKADSTGSAATETTSKGPDTRRKGPGTRRVTVNVTASGYTPSTVEVEAGERLTVVFKRTSAQGCGQEVVFPDHDIRRSLPLNQDVEIELTPSVDESIAFTCGMGMYRGSIVAAR